MESIHGSSTFTHVKFKKDNHNQYFIAIVPSEPLQTKLMGWKQWVFQETGSKGALRSPAHITLHMPFKWKPKKEELLINNLQNLAGSISGFEVALTNFNCFEPRVIYIDVKPNEQLNSLRSEVMSLSQRTLKLDLPKDLRGFKPHITIGFRDLKKPQFYNVWEKLKTKSFEASLHVNSIALLKHNGEKWEVYKSFPAEI